LIATFSRADGHCDREASYGLSAARSIWHSRHWQVNNITLHTSVHFTHDSVHFTQSADLFADLGLSCFLVVALVHALTPSCFVCMLSVSDIAY